MIQLNSQYRRVEQIAFNADGGRLIGFGEQISNPPRAGVEWWDCTNEYKPDRGIAGCVPGSRFCVLPDGGFVVVLPVAGRAHSRLVAFNADGDHPIELPVDHPFSYPPGVSAASGNHLLVGCCSHLPSEIYRFRLPLIAPVEPHHRGGVSPSSSAHCRAFEIAPDSDEFFALESLNLDARVQQRTFAQLEPVGAAIPVLSTTTAIRLAVDVTRLLSIAGPSLFSHDLADTTKPPVKISSGNRKHFTGIAVHPDGRRVFATCNDHTVREYDAVTLQELRAYAWKVGRLRCVAVAPDGATAAAGSDTGKVVVWDLE